MTFGAVPFSESTLAGSAGFGLAGAAPVVVDDTDVAIDPFTIDISGVSFKPLVDSLSINMDASRQGSAAFTLCNIDTIVQVGQPVKISFYDNVLFSGSLDRIKITTNNTQTYKTYECECVDNSFLLTRKKIKKSFTNTNIVTLAQSLIVDNLGGENVTIGTFDNGMPIPMIDASNNTIYDVLRDAAASLGMLFYIDNNRILQFRSTTIDRAPMTIDENVAQSCDVLFDRENYRNQQRVIVTGTPQTQGETVQSVSYTAVNHDQIQALLSIEGDSNAVYTEIETITHPQSNTAGELLKLAVAYANILLALNGQIRKTITIKTRQFGFAVGQLATLSIPQQGLAGDWIIQSLSMQEESGRYLVSNMTLTVTSLQQRNYQMWIDTTRSGKVTVLPPISIFTHSQSFTTPGTYFFAVPAGITTLQATCVGPGGGGGGPARSSYGFKNTVYSLGGAGGKGGKAISVISATAGNILTIRVSAGGSGGIGQSLNNSTQDAIGTDGGTPVSTRVSMGSTVYAEAYGGVGGTGAHANSYTGFNGIWSPSADSGGTGHVVIVGGGAFGGVTGLANPLQNSHPGSDGSVLMEW